MPDDMNIPIGPGPGMPPPPDPRFGNMSYDSNGNTVIMVPNDALRGDEAYKNMSTVTKTANDENDENLDSLSYDKVKFIPYSKPKYRFRTYRKYRAGVKGYNTFRKYIIKKLRKIQSIDDKLAKNKGYPDVAYEKDKLMKKRKNLEAEVKGKINEFNRVLKVNLPNYSKALYNVNYYPDSAYVLKASSPLKYDPHTETINKKGYVSGTNPYMNNGGYVDTSSKKKNDNKEATKSNENKQKKETPKANTKQDTKETNNSKINDAVDNANKAQKMNNKDIYKELLSRYGKERADELFSDDNTNKKEEKIVNNKQEENTDKYASNIAVSKDQTFRKNIKETYDELVRKYGKEYVERNYVKKSFDNGVIRKYSNLDLGLIETTLYLSDDENKEARERFADTYREVATNTISKKNEEILGLPDKSKENSGKVNFVLKDAENKKETESKKVNTINTKIDDSLINDALVPSDYGISKDAFDELKSEGYEVGSKEFESAAKAYGGHELTSETKNALEELQNEKNIEKEANKIKAKGVSENVAIALAKNGLKENDENFEKVINVAKKLESNNKSTNKSNTYEDAINESIEKLETDEEIKNSSAKSNEYGLSNDDYRSIVEAGIKPGTDDFNIASKMHGGHSYVKQDESSKETVYDFSKSDDINELKQLRTELKTALRKAKHDEALNNMLNDNVDSNVNVNNTGKTK